ncbi:hypothetical protein J2X68_006550 [Streptomyces sp. 3330]|uniref:hypothetical protein n=1 Tax=Streptomyces sp. 3330 TaxID=2817755 RepID=UPI002867AE03|nr:hypothetical protein [Streptomyces sp. 3330]MDR6979813.1 hypothetical protein [Streptomyces sp. 3330]
MPVDEDDEEPEDDEEFDDEDEEDEDEEDEEDEPPPAEFAFEVDDSVPPVAVEPDDCCPVPFEPFVSVAPAAAVGAVAVPS